MTRLWNRLACLICINDDEDDEKHIKYIRDGYDATHTHNKGDKTNKIINEISSVHKNLQFTWKRSSQQNKLFTCIKNK